MSKINILDSSIYNRISAGEVVERPSSVVKELIENSLDAGASQITIEIENGGINLIKVTDNGSGIEFDDLQKVFLPHATSKVSKLADLEGIVTFGFRGEALPSIASVSKVELFSNTIGQSVGGKICVEQGKITKTTEYASPVGTTVIVKNLFYNTPARFKFLKTPKQEESIITNIVNRLMLANPTVHFKYFVDGKLIYNANSQTLKDKIYAIYGKSVLENLIELKTEKDGYEISGYISKPAFCKANKTYQTLLINNRYVVNNLVGVAVGNAYENFLMKGKFPLFVLNLKIDFNDVDVNVHPSKMEVKFKNSTNIYSIIYQSILETLNNNNCPVEFEVENAVKFNLKDNSITLNNNLEQEQPKESLKKIDGGFSFNSLNSLKDKLSNISVKAPQYSNEMSKLNSTYIDDDTQPKQVLDEKEMNKNLFENVKDFSTNPTKDTTVSQTEFFLDLNYKLIGTLFNTYIVVENGESIYILDQHAGHERVLFDKFMSDFENKKLITQDLLIPYAFNVNEIEKELIENNLSVFSSLGFGIELFGYKAFKITSIPSILQGINLEEFVFDCLKNLNKISSNNEVIKNHFATCACKAAVKGGQNLSDNEIKVLLNQIISQKTTLLCPHGRPICVKFTKYEIEKMFKRIV